MIKIKSWQKRKRPQASSLKDWELKGYTKRLAGKSSQKMIICEHYLFIYSLIYSQSI
jgi:hypothetical protein